MPGGKLHIGESIESCLTREFREELGLTVEIGPLIDAGFHHLYPDIVVIVYGCYADPTSIPDLSAEHRDIGSFPPAETNFLDMEPLYRRAIASWLRDARSGHGPSPR